MRVTVIITTYNWPEALFMTLQSLFFQSHLPNEVIIADDGSGDETQSLIESFKKRAPFSIIHSWQEDEGFRLAMSRNRAIAKAKGDYIIVIDGDMILHQDFVKDHLNNAEKKLYLQGGRVLLGEKITANLFQKNILPESLSFFSSDIQNRKNTIHSIFLSQLTSRTSCSLKAVKGCNFSLFREDILKVNGFNNEFIGWGREDSEFVARLFNAGLERKNLKFSAIGYHLYHPENTRKTLPKNDQLLQKSIIKNIVRCNDGVERFL